MATWPATLPGPRYSGYQLTPVEPVVRTEMEAGAPRSRRRTAARNDRVAVGWKFTDAQMAIFRAWFDNAAEAAGGAAWFTGLSLPLGTGGLVGVEARFAKVFEAVPVPVLRWQVTAILEVR